MSYRVAMSIHTGTHELGPANGRITLHTTREGVASTAGHDLTIEVQRWSGELTVNDDLTPAGLAVQVDMRSLAVLEGSGGLKPLSDRDRGEIVKTAQKVLTADRHPEASFTAGQFQPGSDGASVISGTLTLGGKQGQLSLQARETAPDRYHASGQVVQSAYGITPYRGFFGALKVSDAVSVDVDVDLSQEAGQG